MELKIEDLKAGDELVCIDRDGYADYCRNEERCTPIDTENLLRINEEYLSELKERLENCQYFEYEAIMIDIDRVNNRIEAIKNGTHGW